MTSSTLSLTDMYMRVLAFLSPEDKLDLISKLIDSMRNNPPSVSRMDKSEIYASFSGYWPDTENEKNESQDKNE